MLTGKFRYRAGWRGRLILQVQERVDNSWNAWSPDDIPPPGWQDTRLIWRDAKIEDFASATITKEGI